MLLRYRETEGYDRWSAAHGAAIVTQDRDIWRASRAKVWSSVVICAPVRYICARKREVNSLHLLVKSSRSSIVEAWWYCWGIWQHALNASISNTQNVYTYYHYYTQLRIFRTGVYGEHYEWIDIDATIERRFASYLYVVDHHAAKRSEHRIQQIYNKPDRAARTSSARSIECWYKMVSQAGLHAVYWFSQHGLYRYPYNI